MGDETHGLMVVRLLTCLGVGIQELACERSKESRKPATVTDREDTAHDLMGHPASEGQMHGRAQTGNKGDGFHVTAP